MEVMKYAIMVIAVLLAVVSRVRADDLRVGELAPDFSAPSSDGTTIHLKAIIGPSPIVLYFYPKDETPGCTKEACGLRDDFAAFRRLKARVFGVSYDSVESHQKFIAHHQLPFPLLSDSDKKIAKLYHADGLLFAKRMTFVIDRAGRIAWINPAVKPATHSAELQAVLQKLAS